MSEVNWDKFEDAVEAVITYLDSKGGFLAQDRLNRPIQTKTVEDAVEAFDGEWNIDTYESCSYSSEYDEFFTHSSSYRHKNGEYLVCTREQFEACAAKKGEKWTHTWNGRKCKVVFTEGCKSWVKGEGLDKLVPTDSLKPIKPKLTKAQAWDMVSGDQSGSVWALKIKYDIIDL